MKTELVKKPVTLKHFEGSAKMFNIKMLIEYFLKLFKQFNLLYIINNKLVFNKITGIS